MALKALVTVSFCGYQKPDMGRLINWTPAAWHRNASQAASPDSFSKSMIVVMPKSTICWKSSGVLGWALRKSLPVGQKSSTFIREALKLVPYRGYG